MYIYESIVVTPPEPASNPNPANWASNVAVKADMSWTAGMGAESHDVYFGTSSSPPFFQNQSGTTFDPGILNNNTTYYWRIDENNSYGTTTGYTWRFTTLSAGMYEVYVQDISMDSKVAGPNRSGIATIWIKDMSGTNIEGATVSGNWSGPVTGTVSGVTGFDGKVTLQSSKVKSGGTFTFTVSDVEVSGYTYNPSLNVETSDSINIP
jgi:hypothetical protein